MSPSKCRIFYLDHLDNAVEAVPHVTMLGDERRRVCMPLVTAIAACPLLAAALDGRCLHVDDVVVHLPSVPTKSIQMFVDFVMGKSICGKYSDMLMLENLCCQFKMKFDMSVLTADNTSEVYIRTEHRDDIVSETMETENRNVGSIADESHEEVYVRAELRDDIVSETIKNENRDVDIIADESREVVYVRDEHQDDIVSATMENENGDIDTIADESREENCAADDDNTSVSSTVNSVCLLPQNNSSVHDTARSTAYDDRDVTSFVDESNGENCTVAADNSETRPQNTGSRRPNTSTDEGPQLPLKYKRVGKVKLTDGVYDGFTCAVCNKLFSKLNQITRHKCPNETSCSQQDKKKQSTRKGIRKVKGKFQCQLCQEVFTKLRWCRAHVEEHNGAKVFKCKHCDECYMTESRYKRHVRTQHREPTLFKCQFCDESFLTLKVRKRHELSKHAGARHKCQFCEKSFTRKNYCIRHELAHVAVQEMTFKCKYCDKVFPNEQSHRIHENLHSVVKPFKCKDCDKGFWTEESCKEHKERHHKHRHHEEKRFKCNVCGKGYHQRRRLLHHKERDCTKPEEVSWKCNYCDKTFNRKQVLTEHERVHTGEKPFKCQHCDKTFTQRSTCKRHEYTHTEEKPFKCNLCGKSFIESLKFDDHMLQHNLTSCDNN